MTYFEYHPPKCARFTSPRWDKHEGYQTWRFAQETDHFIGVYDMTRSELHYKPKTMKIDAYFHRTREMSDEEWESRCSERQAELQVLLQKCKDFWHYDVMGWTRKP